MPHSFNQDKLCAGNGIGRRSSAADVAHAVSEAMDYEGRDFQISQEFGSIAGGNGCDRLTSDSDRIVGTVVGPACSFGNFLLVTRISRRADGAKGAEVLLYDVVTTDWTWPSEDFAECVR